MPMLTLLDFLKLRHNGVPYIEIVDEVIQQIPEVSGKWWDGDSGTWKSVPNMGAGRTIDGLTYPTLVRKSIPTVPFRDFNQGGDPGKVDFENRLVQCKLINPKWKCDRAFENTPTFAERMAEDAKGNTEGAMKTLGSQFYYGAGAGGSEKGHPGLIDFVSADMVINATGSGNAATSVWAVTWGLGHVEWMFGNNISQLSPTPIRYGEATDSAGKQYTAAIQEAFLYPGLKVGSTRSVARIKNLTTASGKGLTIARMNQLNDLWQDKGVKPDAYFMTARSRRQLIDDHITELNKNPGPLYHWEGVPIILTQSITNTETAA